MNALEPILVSVNDAAQMIAVGRVTLYKLIGEGKIKAVKQASRTLIPVQSLKDFAASLPEMQATSNEAVCPDRAGTRAKSHCRQNNQ